MAENYARAVTDFKNSSSRPSMKKGGDLWSMYKGGAGSLYTQGHRPGPNGVGRGLNEQITKGVNFFGYGRNATKSSKAKQDGSGMSSAGTRGGEVQGKHKGKKGDYKLISGFTPGKKQMSDSDFGGNEAGIATVANSSWYTSGLEKVERYGVSGSIKNMLNGRGDSQRHSGNKSTGDGR